MRGGGIFTTVIARAMSVSSEFGGRWVLAWAGGGVEGSRIGVGADAPLVSAPAPSCTSLSQGGSQRKMSRCNSWDAYRAVFGGVEGGFV